MRQVRASLPSSAPSRHPKPKSSNTSSSSSTVIRGFLTPGSLWAAGKSTVKLANKNVWNRWLSAGEDMPREINISTRTNQEKLVRGGKGGTGELLRQFHGAILWFSGAESEPRRQSASKVVSMLRWTARPGLGSSQWQHKSKEHELLSEDTQPTCAGSDLIPSVHLRCVPPPLNAWEYQSSSRHDPQLWSLISAKSKHAN